MLRDELVDHGPAGRQRGHRFFFIAVHQAAVTLDIGGKIAARRLSSGGASI
jgi:hypothetical protein